jgi:hypothetical protein
MEGVEEREKRCSERVQVSKREVDEVDLGEDEAQVPPAVG